MSDQLPPNDYYEYFGPDYRLTIPVEQDRPNSNRKDQLDKVRQGGPSRSGNVWLTTSMLALTGSERGYAEINIVCIVVFLLVDADQKELTATELCLAKLCDTQGAWGRARGVGDGGQWAWKLYGCERKMAGGCGRRE